MDKLKVLITNNQKDVKNSDRNQNVDQTLLSCRPGDGKF